MDRRQARHRHGPGRTPSSSSSSCSSSSTLAARSGRRHNARGAGRPHKHRGETGEAPSTVPAVEEQQEDEEHVSAWWKAGSNRLWPAGTVWVVYVVSLVVRVYMVSDKSSWWILHPDEIFQSLEVAHSEVYGYGFRPYEFLPPASQGPGVISLAERQEAEMGMYSLRSWLYPRVYILLFHVKEWIGWNDNPLLVGKVFHSAIASHLPLAVYAFTGRLTQSPDVATSAAILVTSSEHLVALGTHTLINSFLSPFVFLVIACLYCLLIRDFPAGSSLGGVAGPESAACADDHKVIPSGDQTHDKTPRSDINGNATSNDVGNNQLPVGGQPRRTNDMQVNKTRSRNMNGTSSVPYMQIPPNVDIQLSNAGFENGATQRNESSRELVSRACCLGACGFGVAVLCYIRVDLILFFSVVSLIFFTPLLKDMRSRARDLLFVLAGVSLGVAVGGLDDLQSYRSFMLSPIQWYKFNVHTNFANSLFGLSSSWTYIENIILYNTVTVIQTSLLIGIFLYVVSAFLFKLPEVTAREKQLFRVYLRMILATTLLFVVYSFKGHKEVRFVHNVIVLFQTASALSFIIFYRKLLRVAARWHCTIRVHGMFVFILVATSLIISFPTMDRVWSYKSAWDSRDINECLDFIGRQRDVHGLVSDRSLHETAGYTVLHKDVPLFTLVHYEFHEFDRAARKVLPPTDYFSTYKNISVGVVSKLSNFITTENSPLLLKTIVNNDHYNYLLLKKSRKLLNIGFAEVYSSGTMRVMRRTQDEAQNEALRKIADGIPVGTNATVLEYEGSWLMTYGLRQLAEQRLETAVTLDKSRIRAFQLLGLIYRDMGRADDSRNVIAECYRHNGKSNCNVIQPKVILHRDYPQTIER